MIFNLTKKRVGEAAEDAALHYLQKNGLRLCERNFSCRYGEIDIVMFDNDAVVFVEVRFRKNSHYGSPLESVNHAKQHKIRLSAQHFLQKSNMGETRPIRFDVVGIQPNDIKWIKNAF